VRRLRPKTQRLFATSMRAHGTKHIVFGRIAINKISQDALRFFGANRAKIWTANLRHVRSRGECAHVEKKMKRFRDDDIENDIFDGVETYQKKSLSELALLYESLASKKNVLNEYQQKLTALQQMVEMLQQAVPLRMKELLPHDYMNTNKFASSPEEALDDIQKGHKHLNDHGDFYDFEGNHRITIYLGTNCGMYWKVQPETKEQELLAYEIQRASPIEDDENSINYLSPLIEKAYSLHLRCLLRHDKKTNEKQYSADKRD